MAFRLFLSFAPEDRKFRDALVNHLAPLWMNDEAIVEVLDATSVDFSGPVAPQIAAFIDSADAAVVLMSASYFASARCAGEELPRVMARSGAIQVIPVLLRHCVFNATVLRDRAVLPAPDRPIESPQNHKAWAEVVEALRKVIERHPSPPPSEKVKKREEEEEAPRLSRDDLHTVQAAAVKRGLAPRVLTSGLPQEIVARLTTEASVAATLTKHLTELNEEDRLPDGELPIVVWLKNAIQLTPLQKEQRVFQAMIAKLEAAGNKGSAR